uniref:Uncharacterized protein n=1 Tax=viral metagenome TaxID=1070528 RepID=A0A6C0IFM0_9ZZZZ
MSEFVSNNMFDSKDMIFNNQSGGGIQSGGLSIKSIMLSKGISPIMSINTDKDPENVERVSELFENLVIPLGLINGIKHINSGYNIDYHSNNNDNKNIYEDDDEIDTFYNELLKLVEPNEKEINNNELLFSGGKKKNKSKKNRELKSQSKINGVAKSKKNMKIKIVN